MFRLIAFFQQPLLPQSSLPHANYIISHSFTILLHAAASFSGFHSHCSALVLPLTTCLLCHIHACLFPAHDHTAIFHCSAFTLPSSPSHILPALIISSKLLTSLPLGLPVSASSTPALPPAFLGHCHHCFAAPSPSAAFITITFKLSAFISVRNLHVQPLLHFSSAGLTFSALQASRPQLHIRSFSTEQPSVLSIPTSRHHSPPPLSHGSLLIPHCHSQPAHAVSPTFILTQLQLVPLAASASVPLLFTASNCLCSAQVCHLPAATQPSFTSRSTISCCFISLLSRCMLPSLGCS